MGGQGTLQQVGGVVGGGGGGCMFAASVKSLHSHFT